jgi:hypothetical protein
MRSDNSIACVGDRRNPIQIIVHFHRVVKSQQSLCGSFSLMLMTACRAPTERGLCMQTQSLHSGGSTPRDPQNSDVRSVAQQAAVSVRRRDKERKRQTLDRPSADTRHTYSLPSPPPIQIRQRFLLVHSSRTQIERRAKRKNKNDI